MKRTSAVLAAGLLTIATAPPQLPLPPIPPALGPGDQAAPVPDERVRGPEVTASEDTHFNIQMFRVHRFNTSRGFMPGSHYESSEDRRPIQTPGFIVTVPLE